MYGYKRRVLSSVARSIKDVDLAALDAHLAQLQMLSLSTPYAKQKSSLKSEFEDFLFSLPGRRSLYSATPLDVCHFLSWKDKGGKTQVHGLSCPHLGNNGVFPCDCPLRVSYKTVDSYGAIFRSIGQEGDWDSSLSLGNPAASLNVKGPLPTKIRCAPQTL